MDAAGEIVELVKNLEAALAIVKYNAASQLNLTLQKAEVEVELIATREARAASRWNLQYVSTPPPSANGRTSIS